MATEQGDQPKGIKARLAARKQSGHTRWKRFAATMTLGGLASGALVFGMSQGAIAASFAASGSSFGINAKKLDGNGLSMYGSEVRSTSGSKQAATIGVPAGKIQQFCSSIPVGKLPVVGNVSLGMQAPQVDGKGLVLDVGDLDAGQMQLNKANLGIDARSVGGRSGSTGLKAGGVSASDLKGNTWSLSAGTMTAKGLKLGAKVGGGDLCQ